MKRFLIVVSALILAVAAGSSTAMASQSPTVIPFDKHYNPAASAANGTTTWTGVAGHGATVQVRLVDFRLSGDAEHLTVDWTVSMGSRSFDARLTGIFDDSTERAVLNGVVTAGWLRGAQVHEEGIRVDAATSRIQGTLQLMPATA